MLSSDCKYYKEAMKQKRGKDLTNLKDWETQIDSTNVCGFNCSRFESHAQALIITSSRNKARSEAWAIRSTEQRHSNQRAKPTNESKSVRHDSPLVLT